MKKLVLFTLCAVLAAGCAGRPGPTPGGDVEDQRATLQQRPSIEEVTARYDQMQRELRERLSAEIGSLSWTPREPMSNAGCADFPNLGGETRMLESWRSSGNLPDANWPRAVRVVGEVTARYGFGAVEVVVDRPGDHQITATDQYGGSYLFGTAKNTLLTVSTGCHLPQGG
ncbi:hypothetical protein HUO13_05095 [Saccharopolyspora erythraea]|uniref:LppA family lipoprotein n=1 Tax=Saccharopolyspora erythraea TaxID=1836 RepID=UPI001BA74791|nr:LppA family lipoprotein [Saccharopolyspora erythraea]QUH00272.1 hypothetical protein HUO13_05095 [Saccharopolyspora erythraea]